MRLLIMDLMVHPIEELCALLQDKSPEILVRTDECGWNEVQSELGSFDLIVLGSEMEGCWRYLDDCRKRSSIPILLLTTSGIIEERIRGFESGADDCLEKPFDVREFAGRIRSLLRRSWERTSRIAVRDLELNLDTRNANRAGHPLNLTRNEFLTLLLLIRSHDRVVSRDVISENILGRKHSGNSNAVEVLIRRLRAKVDEGFTQELIRTVRGMGYMLSSTGTDRPSSF